MAEELENSRSIRALLPGLLLVGLIWLGYLVLREFTQTLVWAFIVSYIAWPAHCRVRQKLHSRNSLSAAITAGTIAVVVLTVLYSLADLLQGEIKQVYQAVVEGLNDPEFQLPEFVAKLPWIGTYLQSRTAELLADRAELAAQTANWLQHWLGDAAKFISGIGQYALKLCVMLVTLFFCFRDGDRGIAEIREGLVRFAGKHREDYLRAAGDTTRAVVYGLVLAALAQGVVAGVGYAFAGVRAPILFGAVTALLALVPMGATVVWVPLGLGLLASGSPWQGMGLLAWGFFVISTIDNLIRPLVISGAGRVPFMTVILGVLGGLSAFGPIGLFVGPVILAVLHTVWLCWIRQQSDERKDLSSAE